MRGAGGSNMGTRAMVYVIDDLDYPVPIVQIYKHTDGYPSGQTGMCRKLYDFLRGRVVTNGIPGGKMHDNLSNGMQDLAAQLVQDMKKKHIIGNIYLYPLGRLPREGESFEDYVLDYMTPYAMGCGCEYVYIVRYIDGSGLDVQVWDDPAAPLYAGSPEGLKAKFDLGD